MHTRRAVKKVYLSYLGDGRTRGCIMTFMHAGVPALQDLTAALNTASLLQLLGAAAGPPLRRGRVYVYAYNDTI